MTLPNFTSSLRAEGVHYDLHANLDNTISVIYNDGLSESIFDAIGKCIKVIDIDNFVDCVSYLDAKNAEYGVIHHNDGTMSIEVDCGAYEYVCAPDGDIIEVIKRNLDAPTTYAIFGIDADLNCERTWHTFANDVIALIDGAMFATSSGYISYSIVDHNGNKIN